MPGVFDRLTKDLKEREKATSPSALDIAELPAPQRRIVRLLLRELEMTYPGLCQAVDALPPAERFSRAEMDEGLAALTRQGWLIRLGEADLKTYKVNLRRKAGSALGLGIWSSLTTKIEETKPAESSPPEEKK